jgi:hypothetical protein
MKWLTDGETWASALKHPIVLAGAAVVALLGLTAGILIIVDAAGGDAADPPAVIVDPVTTVTPGNAVRTAEAIGVRGRTLAVTTVRQAPGLSSPVRGTLPRNVNVVVDGRSDESGWFRIIFPINSETHGWVDAEDLELTGDLTLLVIATAEPPVIVEVPTSIPQITPEPSETGDTPTPESTATPPDAGLPDLVVGTTPILSGGLLFVTVVNQGQGDAVGDLVVAVFNADGTALLAGATLPAFTLGGGLSIDVGTGLAVTENQTLLLIVDPNGTIEETDNTNNRITVAIAVGNPPPPPPPIETPIPEAPPPAP